MAVFLIVVWILLGGVGYLLMRQGFLVDFEYALGKKGAWGKAETAFGIFCILSGPIFILVAFIVKGRLCCRKRQ